MQLYRSTLKALCFADNNTDSHDISTITVRNTSTRFCINLVISMILLCILVISPVASEESVSFSISIKGMGQVILEKSAFDQFNTSQLILKKSGGVRHVIDSYSGFLPAGLDKYNLDSDGNNGLIVLLRHPDGVNAVLKLYSTAYGFKRIFLEGSDEKSLFVCHNVFATSHNNYPALCARHLINFHDFGPPELYQLELYISKKNKMILVNKSFSEGNHFNIFMNRGALAFNDGQYSEAEKMYNTSISSSTGDIPPLAFVESLFYMAESRKFLKDFDGALKLYQKIVLEFEQNLFIDVSQQEIELISGNKNNLDALSLLVEIDGCINSKQWETAMKIFKNHSIVEKVTNPLWGRIMLAKIEVLIATNCLEEAIKTYHVIKERFPDSILLEEASAVIENINSIDEKTGGL